MKAEKEKAIDSILILGDYAEHKLAQKNNTGNFSMNRYYWSGTIYDGKIPPPYISLDFSKGEEDWSDLYDPNNFPKTRAVKSISR
jgi:hypothetical protein